MTMTFTRTRTRRGSMSPKAMIITAGCLLVGGWFIHGMYGAVSAYAAEQNAMDDAMMVAAPLLEPGAVDDAFGPAPYLTGGVLVVNEDAGQPDQMMFARLPESMRVGPDNPIGTMVTYSHFDEKVGEYRNADTGEYSGDAFQTMWDICIIDVDRRAIIGRTVLVGAQPKQTIRHEGASYGEPPRGKLVKYLQSLPVK